MPAYSHIRSEEVNDIIGRTPHWLVRWGITLVFVSILIIVFISYLVQYPDVIEAQVNLITSKPSQEFKAKTPSRIASLIVSDQHLVDSGQVIAILDGPVKPEAINYLSGFIPKVENFLHLDGGIPVINSSIDLGVLNSLVVEIHSACTQLEINRTQTYTVQRTESLKQELESYQRLISQSIRNIEIHKAEQGNAMKDFKSSKKLFAEKVLSRSEFHIEETKYRSKVMQLENAKTQLIQNRITLSQLRQKLLDVQEGEDERSRALKMAIEKNLSQLKDYLGQWRTDYCFISNIKGKVNYTRKIRPLDLIQPDETIFSIVPEDQHFSAIAVFPANGAGKIAIGQQVHIGLLDYPKAEYGEINGEVKKIFSVIKEGTYRAGIEIPQDGLTSYKKQLRLKPGMLGNAKIITKDRRLIERVFSNLRKLVENR